MSTSNATMRTAACQDEWKGLKEGRSKPKQKTIAEADEELRLKLLERDGGSASVPTKEGRWEDEMGRETSRQMFRVLDQTRQHTPEKRYGKK